MVTLLSLPAELRVYILRLGGTVGFCQCEKCSRVSLADGLSSDDCECGSPAGVEDAYISTATMWFWVNRSTSLPASLRQSTWCWNASGSTLEWRKQKASVVSTAQPEVATVCKQIRFDALSEFYGCNVFVFTMFDIDADAPTILKWLETIGPSSASLLRRVIIVHRVKRHRRYIRKSLLPKMETLGLRLQHDLVSLVKVKRLEYPYCFCQGCIMKAAGCVNAAEE